MLCGPAYISRVFAALVAHNLRLMVRAARAVFARVVSRSAQVASNLAEPLARPFLVRGAPWAIERAQVERVTHTKSQLLKKKN